MSAYYNEIDKFAAQWLRELIKAGAIAPGDVDERSIIDVQPDDLKGYTQCHFFAGIGGWSAALRLACWPDDRPIWTGSCPCQPFSTAGLRKGFDDERHLWPEFYRLIDECRPDCIAGEQVASKDALAWFDNVQADLERAGYACGVCDTCAAGFGAPHIRQRLYWIVHAQSSGYQQRIVGNETDAQRSSSCGWQARSGWNDAANGISNDGMAHSASPRCFDGQAQRYCDNTLYGETARLQDAAENCAGAGRLAHFENKRLQSRPPDNGSIYAASRETSEILRIGSNSQAGSWLGNAQCERLQGQSQSDRSPQGWQEQAGCAVNTSDVIGGMEDTQCERLQGWPQSGLEERSSASFNCGSDMSCGMEDTKPYGWRGRSDGDTGGMRGEVQIEGRAAFSGSMPTNGFWRNPDWLWCRDKKWRPIKSGSVPLVDGFPERVVPCSNSRLKGYGNAIVVPQAAEIIKCFMEILDDARGQGQGSG